MSERELAAISALDRDLLARAVASLYQESLAAAFRYMHARDAWFADENRLRVGIQIVHREGGQSLDLTIDFEASHMQDISEGIGRIFHPIRVAHDRIEKNKRQLGLSPSIWPPEDDVWATVRAIDNLSKHDRPVPLEFWLVSLGIEVADVHRRKRAGWLETSIEPLAVPERGTVAFRIAQEIPTEWQGPNWGYGSMPIAELRIGVFRGHDVVESIDELIKRALAAGKHLKELVAQSAQIAGTQQP